MKLVLLQIMQTMKINKKQLAEIHSEIYGQKSSNSQISIQLQKLEKSILGNDRINHEVIDIFQ